MKDFVSIIAPIVGSVLGYAAAKLERRGNDIDLSREIKKSVKDNESLRIENSNLQIEINNLKEELKDLRADNKNMRDEIRHIKKELTNGKS